MNKTENSQPRKISEDKKQDTAKKDERKQKNKFIFKTFLIAVSFFLSFHIFLVKVTFSGSAWINMLCDTYPLPLTFCTQKTIQDKLAKFPSFQAQYFVHKCFDTSKSYTVDTYLFILMFISKNYFYSSLFSSSDML